MPGTRSVTFESGYIVVDHGSGPPARYPIANVLRGQDLPETTNTEASTRILSIPVLSNLIVILIRALISRGVLDESFVDDMDMDFDLDHLIFVIEQMGGTYHKPDLHGE